MQARLINDDTGWTDVMELPHDDFASVSLPAQSVAGGRHPTNAGVGITLFFRSGDRDADGLPIYRTRQQ